MSKYTLDEINLFYPATRTNRVFDGWFGDATSESPIYWDEFSAEGVAPDGKILTVKWTFEQELGVKKDDDDLDWSNPENYEID